MNRQKKTSEEMAADKRKRHLDYLEEITSVDQLSTGDVVLALRKEQLPDPSNVGNYHWNWDMSSTIRVVEEIFSFDNKTTVSLVGIDNNGHGKNRYSLDVEDNYDIEKLYRANPFHIALGLTESVSKKGRSGKDLIMMPGIPSPNDCDSILLTIFTKHLDEVFLAMDGFKAFGVSIDFHKAFRSWGVTDIGMVDSIAWDAMNGSELFHHFYNELVLNQFDEWKEMIKKESE